MESQKRSMTYTAGKRYTIRDVVFRYASRGEMLVPIIGGTKAPPMTLS